MKQDYHSFILSRLLDLRNQHQRAYKQIVEKCIAESIFNLNELFSFVLFMTVLLPSHCTNRIITDYISGVLCSVLRRASGT